MPEFQTESSLLADLRDLGVDQGTTVMVHASLSALGRVIGGEQAVVAALQTAVGRQGTVVMPAQSWQLCDPAFLNEPGVPPDAWQQVRDALPIYDPARTPTRTMGKVAELFRTLPDALRSEHPHRSIAAAGASAADVVAVHELASPAGEASPLRALYDCGGFVLLLGVTFKKCTALHLAEHRAHYPGKHDVPNGAALLIEGRRAWVEWNELWLDDEDFDEVASAFGQATHSVRAGGVGTARAVLAPVAPLIDFSAEWFSRHRR